MCNNTTDRSHFFPILPMLPHPLPAPMPQRAAEDAARITPTPQRAAEDAGRVVSFRAVRHGETGLVERVFAGLGEQSRYQRFHGPKPRLSESDRAHLSAVDGRDHLAVVALAPDGAPLGLARCIRLRDDRTTADLAAEVIDDRQRQGIGTALVARLARRAAQAGIERLSATVLAETGLQRALLRRGWQVTAADGPALTLEVPVWTVLRAA
jgi:GNAT superfamily N-acetyltransferase